jgi:hypothetical protein
MKRYLYAGLIVGILAFLLIGPPRQSREDWWRKDLRYLESELPARHLNAFFKVTPKDFHRAIDDLDATLPSLRDPEIVVGMKRIVTMIGDPHTDLDVDFSHFPMRLEWLTDGYYVIATTSVYRRTLRSRLTKIGDVDIEKAYLAITTVIPHDNAYWVRQKSAELLVAPAVLNALKILPQTDRAQFHFEDNNRNRFSLDLAPATTSIDPDDWLQAPDRTKVTLPLYLRKLNVYYWMNELRNAQTLYFQYNRCEEMESLPFDKFTEQLFNLADSSSIKRLIIDLRYNSGGNSGILWPFIVELKNRPSLNQKGHLFVIIGSSTYSSGVLNAAELREQTNAILVGEPTGARPNMYGEYKHFSLPNSGISVSYSTKRFTRVKGDPPALAPDILVRVTAADYFAGRDPVLEKILAYKDKEKTVYAKPGRLIE